MLLTGVVDASFVMSHRIMKKKIGRIVFISIKILNNFSFKDCVVVVNFLKMNKDKYNFMKVNIMIMFVNIV